MPWLARQDPPAILRILRKTQRRFARRSRSARVVPNEASRRVPPVWLKHTALRCARHSCGMNGAMSELRLLFETSRRRCKHGCLFDRLATQCPTHHSFIGWFGKPPLPFPNQALDESGQLATVEIANCAGFKYRNHRQCALDAAMDALRIAVMKMRSHDAKRKISFHALVELKSAKSLAACLLSRNKQGAANERADRRP